MAATAGIARMLDVLDAQHYLNAPGHGTAMLERIKGEIHNLHRDRSDDPLLFAYQLRDALPRIAGLLIDLEKWGYAVLECNDPELPSRGAR